MARTGKNRLSVDQLYKAIEAVEESLPDIVQEIVNDLLDPEKNFAMKDRLAAVRMLRDVASMGPRVEDDLGLRQKEATSESPIMALFNTQGISLIQFRGMKPEQRQKLVLEALAGSLPEPVEAVVSDAE